MAFSDGVKDLLALMKQYPTAQRERFGQHPLHGTLRRLRDVFGDLDAVRSRAFLKVKASVGQGNWAVVPWIAVLDSRETLTTRNGVYVIVLLCADMSGLYVTLNQGITLPSERLGRGAARAALLDRAAAIRSRFPNLSSRGFEIDNSAIDLKTNHGNAKAYREMAIASRYFPKSALSSPDDFARVLTNALAIYEDYVQSPIPLPLPGPGFRDRSFA